VRDKESGSIIADMTGTEAAIIAKGGSGGWGNKRFATPTRQAPRFAKHGLPGEEMEVVLELKLIADVGIIGLPNAGKSTLLSVVSNARPKIADYPFTTLHPNLGVVYVDDDRSFVAADIPGIIEGASEGQGLGYDFLRHIDRCRLLIHVVDAVGSEGRDPVADFEAINEELRKYNPGLAARPQLVAANKCDLAQGGEEYAEALARFESYARKHGYNVHKISAATGGGVRELTYAIAGELDKLPPIAVFEPDYAPKPRTQARPEDLTLENYDGVWTVDGEWVERLLQNVNFADYESRMYFERVMRDAGVYKRLEDMGMKEGDTVVIGDMEFEYRM
jgi:GTP-binding protein